MKFMLTAVVCASIACSSSAQDKVAPLGIAKGMSIQQILAKGAKPDLKNKGWYDIGSTPVQGLERMSVLATPETGACKVFGSIVFKSNQAGTQVREKFENFISLLTSKYGAPSNTFDFVRPTALWKEDHEFMYALASRERELFAIWEEGLPSDLTAISVRAHASNPYSAGIIVTYEFSNLDECFRILKAQSRNDL